MSHTQGVDKSSQNNNKPDTDKSAEPVRPDQALMQKLIKDAAGQIDQNRPESPDSNDGQPSDGEVGNDNGNPYDDWSQWKSTAEGQAAIRQAASGLLGEQGGAVADALIKQGAQQDQLSMLEIGQDHLDGNQAWLDGNQGALDDQQSALDDQWQASDAAPGLAATQKQKDRAQTTQSQAQADQDTTQDRMDGAWDRRDGTVVGGIIKASDSAVAAAPRLEASPASPGEPGATSQPAAGEQGAAEGQAAASAARVDEAAGFARIEAAVPQNGDGTNPSEVVAAVAAVGAEAPAAAQDYAAGTAAAVAAASNGETRAQGIQQLQALGFDSNDAAQRDGSAEFSDSAWFGKDGQSLTDTMRQYAGNKPQAREEFNWAEWDANQRNGGVQDGLINASEATDSAGLGMNEDQFNATAGADGYLSADEYAAGRLSGAITYADRLERADLSMQPRA